MEVVFKCECGATEDVVELWNGGNACVDCLMEDKTECKKCSSAENLIPMVVNDVFRGAWCKSCVMKDWEDSRWPNRNIPKCSTCEGGDEHHPMCDDCFDETFWVHEK